MLTLAPSHEPVHSCAISTPWGAYYYRAAIVTVLGILLYTLPSLSYWVLIHLCEVKQVRVKCLVQVYNIEATVN